MPLSQFPDPAVCGLSRSCVVNECRGCVIESVCTQIGNHQCAPAFTSEGSSNTDYWRRDWRDWSYTHQVTHCGTYRKRYGSTSASKINTSPSLNLLVAAKEPSNEAFTWRRAEYFFHNRAASGVACAQATALRTHMAPKLPARTWLPNCPHARGSSNCPAPPLTPF